MYTYIYVCVYTQKHAHTMIHMHLRDINASLGMSTNARMALQTLQHTATHCNTLQHTAPHCTTLQHQVDTATHRDTPQHTTTRCSTLQHTATHCITLQPPETHCNTLQHTATHYTHCNMCIMHIILHYTATHCNTLQHTATHYTHCNMCIMHMCMRILREVSPCRHQWARQWTKSARRARLTYLRVGE